MLITQYILTYPILIAGKMGISQSTYNRKENGLADFSLS